MTEYVAVIQARHGDLRNDHLEEGGEGREDTKLVRFKTKAGGGGKVSALHDSGRNKHVRMSLVDHLQTSRTLQIACAVRASAPGRIYNLNKIRTVNDHDLACGLVFGQAVKHGAHGFAKYNAICIEVTC